MMMTTTRVLLVLCTFLINRASAKVSYTKESFAASGRSCLTDCDESRKCWTSKDREETCHPGFRTALTYYTARDRYPGISKCLSKCVFEGYDYSWCYIDQDFNWDYCSTDTRGITKWYQYTKGYGRCKDQCSSALWCYTFWAGRDSWDYCDQTYYYEEDSLTVYGKKCFGRCLRHDGNYYWCYDETRNKAMCAPSSVRHECPRNRQRRRTDGCSRRTVQQYNRDIDNDRTLNTTVLSSVNQPDDHNPILDYTFRDIGHGVRLPVRVRARILPRHVRESNSRRNVIDISSAARTNCNAMGMYKCLSNGNHDQCGHLVPYIVGGPPDWYNIVPQTQRINIGTANNTDIVSRSLWADTERGMRHWVENGGSVHYEVVVTYDLATSTRPTGFGTIERYYAPDGTLSYECPGYWYSNHPYVDPDILNY